MGTGGIAGMMAPDQWGNSWIRVEIRSGSNQIAVVSIFDCDGKPRDIGTEPAKSIGSGNDFAGFHPYDSATLDDWMAIANQAAWETKCLSDSAAEHACDPNPKRTDCVVSERPNPDGPSRMVTEPVWRAYNRMHPQKPTH
jgi:hypothetical protein